MPSRFLRFRFLARLPGTLALVLVALVVSSRAPAAEAQRVTVVDPFVELHSGAGRGYPVLEVVEHGTEVEILARRTTWYLLRTVRGNRGWAPREQMLRTLTPAGETFREDEVTEEDFRDHRWEAGAWLGDYEGSALLGFHGAWRFIPTASLDLGFSQVVGRAADSLVLDASLVAHPFPAWSWSPYAGIGTGLVQTRPAAVLVAAHKREDQALSPVLGVEHRVSQAFVLRLEYRPCRLLTGRDEQEIIETWKTGLSVFF